MVLWRDEIHFAPPKKPWHDDSPVNTNRPWIPMVSKWFEMDFVPPQYASKKGTASFFKLATALCERPTFAGPTPSTIEAWSQHIGRALRQLSAWVVF